MFRLFGFLAFVALASASNVVDLTSANFDEIVNGDRAAFVEFYAPWCGHCKNLAPAYEQVADAFSSISEVVIAKVDADADRALGGRFGVSGFPTLKFFPKGSTTPEDYSGGRTAEDIVDFVNKKTGYRGRIKVAPSDVVTLDDDNFDSVVMNADKDVLVEFYAPWCGHCKSLAPVYEKVGTDFKGDEHVVIAKMDADKHKTIPQRYGVSGFPTLKWFPKGNKAGEEYSGGRDETSFVTFINEKAGTQRLVGGALNSQAGRTDELDSLVKQFYQDVSNRAETVRQATILGESSTTDKLHASYYAKVMQKVTEEGHVYVGNEIARIEKLLKSGNVKADKLDSFYKRKNILSQFAAQQ